MFPLISRLKIKTKLLLFSLLVVFLPVAVIGIILTNRLTGILLQQNTVETRNFIEQSSQNLKNNVELIEKLSDSIYLDKNISRSLVKKYDKKAESVEIYLDVLDESINKNKHLHSRIINFISIYTENETILMDGDVIKVASEDIKNQDWYRRAVEQNGLKIWGNAEKQDDKYNISLYRSLKTSSNKIYGVLEINLKEKEFLRSLINAHDNERKLFIVNPSGSIVSSNDTDKIGTSAPKTGYLECIFKKKQDNCEYGNGNGKLDIMYNTISVFYGDSRNWKVASAVPLKSILSKAVKARNFSIFLCTLVFLAMAIVITLFSSGISSRIKRLADQTYHIVKGRYRSYLDNMGNDEIGQLASSFNNMQEHLNTLINEVYEDKIKMQEYQLTNREAELFALQNQINPHFLYNTLDAIRMEAVINEDEKVSDMILSLSTLLRYNLSRGKDVVSLRRELDNLKNYISLMNIRYDNRISISFGIDNKLYNYPVMKFLIQPIVENAFQHGMVQNSKNALIAITGTVKGDSINIDISDNGVGMNNEKMQQMNSELEVQNKKNDNSRGIGLHNVNRRIKLNFGNEYGVRLFRDKLGYTTVRLILPKNIGDDNGEESIICG